MQGKTHTRGGEVAALTGCLLLSSRGALSYDTIPGVVSFAVIYPFAIWGSTAPDQDHGKQSIPNRDVVSYALHKLLHLTTGIRSHMNTHDPMYEVLGVFDAKHRSWQTHSFESLALLIWLTVWMSSPDSLTMFSPITAQILRLVLIGISLGWMSHIILDGITPDGIWIATFMFINKITGKKILPEKLKVVPHTTFFATGHGWELGAGWWPGWRMILTATSVVMFIILVLEWTGLLPQILAAITM